MLYYSVGAAGVKWMHTQAPAQVRSPNQRVLGSSLPRAQKLEAPIEASETKTASKIVTICEASLIFENVLPQLEWKLPPIPRFACSSR